MDCNDDKEPSTHSIKSTKSSTMKQNKKETENDQNEYIKVSTIIAEESEDECDENVNENKGKQPPKPLNLSRIELNANCEFVAYGISNVIGSFFSAFAVSGSF